MKIKLCPFCGAKAEVFYQGDDTWVVDCTECDTWKIGDTEEEAILRWNTRAP